MHLISPNRIYMSKQFNEKLVESLELQELSEREEFVSMAAEQQETNQDGITLFDWTINI